MQLKPHHRETHQVDKLCHHHLVGSIIRVHHKMKSVSKEGAPAGVGIQNRVITVVTLMNVMNQMEVRADLLPFVPTSMVGSCVIVPLDILEILLPFVILMVSEL